jgi:hypothetical protein
LKLKKGNGADRKFWDIFPREDTSMETVWKSISERTGVGKSDLIAVDCSNQEVTIGTLLLPGDCLEVVRRAQFIPGQGGTQSKEGKATIFVGRTSRVDGIITIDNILRNAKRVAGTGGCLIMKGEAIWDDSPVQDGDQFTLRALGPGGGKDAVPNDEVSESELIWQQGVADDWPQAIRAEYSENEEIFRPADLSLDTSIQGLEEISEMERWDSMRPTLPVPVATPRFRNVQVMTMTSWGEMIYTMEKRRYHKPKKVTLLEKRLREIEERLGRTAE